MTYATLQSDIASYLHRTDLTSVLPTLIARAESHLFRELNLRDQEASVTGVTVAGAIVLPTDFGSVVRVTINYSGTEIELDYAKEPLDYTGTIPRSYAMESGGLRLYPAAGDGYAYTLYYNAKLSPLSDSVTTNWLLDNAPDLYLYASALEVARWTQNMEQVAALSQLVPQLLDSVRRLSERKAMPSRGGLRIKVRGM